jgi:hypothetical protein
MDEIELNQETRDLLDRVRHKRKCLTLFDMPEDLVEAAVWEIGKVVLDNQHLPLTEHGQCRWFLRDLSRLLRTNPLPAASRNSPARKAASGCLPSVYDRAKRCGRGSAAGPRPLASCVSALHRYRHFCRVVWRKSWVILRQRLRAISP